MTSSAPGGTGEHDGESGSPAAWLAVLCAWTPLCFGIGMLVGYLVL